MNLSNLLLWSAGVIISWAGFEHINDIQRNILKAQAKLVYEARASNWGTPRFLQQPVNGKIKEKSVIEKGK